MPIDKIMQHIATSQPVYIEIQLTGEILKLVKL